MAYKAQFTHHTFLQVKPVRGAALFNIHNVLHQGDTVTAGTKYVIRYG